MKQKVYSIFDEKAKAYARPFYFNHHGEALRAFESVVTGKESDISKFPGDYKLYHLGEFDNLSGKFVSLREPVFLANASDYVVVKKESDVVGV